ncbi:hypothetical protein HZA97_03080 [Candidatus Woesearchaeota archaeon]|nr:hypothetical protein [Candidatus Woesearchaeota archaeon]
MMERVGIYQVYDAKYTKTGHEKSVIHLGEQTVVATNLTEAVSKYLTEVGFDKLSVLSGEGKLELKLKQVGAQG